jgi:hypothetical protein
MLIASVFMLFVISYSAYRFTLGARLKALFNSPMERALALTEDNCRSESARILAVADNLSKYAMTLPNGGASPEMTTQMHEEMAKKIHAEVSQLNSSFELAALARICRAMFVLKVDSCKPFGGVFDLAFWTCVETISNNDADDRNLEPLYRSSNLGEPERAIFLDYLESQKRKNENKTAH